MILDELAAVTRTALIARKLRRPEQTLLAQLSDAPPPLDFATALRRPGVSVIAEVKRASPSRGALNLGLEPAELAVAYARAGADGISVLTEESHFRGSLDDLVSAREGLSAAGLACPILRKDFVVDSYQLAEARLAGADAILLIAAILGDRDLGVLFDGALSVGLTPVVEVHTEQELMRVLTLDPPIVGINNRDLRDFSVSLDTTRRLRPLIPQGCLVVSESGIAGPDAMGELAVLGVDAALIGEALVTADEPAARLRELKEGGE
jgi:indole-3-glycerol phosphate synthase